MIAFAFILIGLLLVVLQTSLMMVNPVWVGSPDLYYILVAYLAYRFDLLRSLIIIFPNLERSISKIVIRPDVSGNGSE